MWRLHDCGCSVPLSCKRQSLGHYDDANYGHMAVSILKHCRNPGPTTQKVPSWVGGLCLCSNGLGTVGAGGWRAVALKNSKPVE